MLRKGAEFVTADVPGEHEARVEWACGAFETERGSVVFMATVHALEDADEGGTYARVLGIRDVVVSAFRQAHR